MPSRKRNKRKRNSTTLDGAPPSGGTATLTSSDTRPDEQDTVNTSLSALALRRKDANPQHDLALQSHPGHTYGPVIVDGQSKVHLGDVVQNYGEGARVGEHYTVEGDIHVHNTHYSTVSEVRGPYHDASQQLRKTLYYASMDNRRAQLNDHTIASFEWIWEETTFPTWLKSDQGLYWIQGKPASGKSTLLNYLTSPSQQSRRVEAQLKVHHAAPLLLYFFFDFRAGKGIANTPVGMLRSMLLQMVQKSPAVEEHIQRRHAYRSEGQWPELESELIDMLCDAIQTQELFVCGFLDGLDEFEGNLLNLINSILRLQARSGMKLCLASRPEAQIAHKLSRFESFRMQDFNRSTIENYTGQQFADLTQYLDQKDLAYLATRISSDANGVILWARFAVDEIVCAILGGNNVQDVTSLLDSFPSELEDIYRRIWDRLTNSQKQQAAVIFSVVEANTTGRGGYDIGHRGERLLILSHRILSQLGWTRLVSSSGELKLSQFRLKIQSLLHGLIEFRNSTGYPEDLMAFIVHKTLNTFLSMNEQYQKMLNRTREAMGFEHWGTLYYTQNIISVSEFTQTHPGYRNYYGLKSWGFSSTDLDRRPIWDSDRELILPSPRLVQRSTVYLFDLYEPALCSPQSDNLILAASQTAFFRSAYPEFLHHDLDRRPLPGFSDCLLLRTNPELFLFVKHGHLNNYLTVWRQISDTVTDDVKNLLFAYALFSRGSTARWQICATERGHRDAWSVVWHLANGLSNAARILTLFAASEVELHDVEQVLSHAAEVPTLYDWTIPKSIWWPHKPCHLLVAWAGSPFNTTSKVVQRSRLARLLEPGVSLNDTIYEGGTVLDALLDPYLWVVNIFRKMLDGFKQDKSHFSKAKFEALLEAGFQIDRHGERFIEAAKKLSLHLEARKNRPRDKDEVRPIGRKELLTSKIADIKEFVIPVLEGKADSSKT